MGCLEVDGMSCCELQLPSTGQVPNITGVKSHHADDSGGELTSAGRILCLFVFSYLNS